MKAFIIPVSAAGPPVKIQQPLDFFHSSTSYVDSPSPSVSLLSLINPKKFSGISIIYTGFVHSQGGQLIRYLLRCSGRFLRTALILRHKFQGYVGVFKAQVEYRVERDCCYHSFSGLTYPVFHTEEQLLLVIFRRLHGELLEDEKLGTRVPDQALVFQALIGKRYGSMRATAWLYSTCDYQIDYSIKARKRGVRLQRGIRIS